MGVSVSELRDASTQGGYIFFVSLQSDRAAYCALRAAEDHALVREERSVAIDTLPAASERLQTQG
jgi:hypothetical protein